MWSLNPTEMVMALDVATMTKRIRERRRHTIKKKKSFTASHVALHVSHLLFDGSSELISSWNRDLNIKKVMFDY